MGSGRAGCGTLSEESWRCGPPRPALRGGGREKGATTCEDSADLVSWTLPCNFIGAARERAGAERRGSCDWVAGQSGKRLPRFDWGE